MGIGHKTEQIRYHQMRPGNYTIIKNVYVLRGAKFIAEFFVDMKPFVSIYVGVWKHV